MAEVYKNGDFSLRTKRLDSMSEVEDLIDTPPSWLLRSGITMIFLLLSIALSFSYFVSYSDKVILDGKFTTDLLPFDLKCNSSAFIHEVHIVDGQYVSVGDTILTFCNSHFTIDKTSTHDGNTRIDHYIDEITNDSIDREEANINEATHGIYCNWKFERYPGSWMHSQLLFAPISGRLNYLPIAQEGRPVTELDVLAYITPKVVYCTISVECKTELCDQFDIGQVVKVGTIQYGRSKVIKDVAVISAITQLPISREQNVTRCAFLCEMLTQPKGGNIKQILCGDRRVVYVEVHSESKSLFDRLIESVSSTF